MLITCIANHMKELMEQINHRRTELQDALIAGGEPEVKLQAAEKQYVISMIFSLLLRLINSKHFEAARSHRITAG
jgi:hypothetical protein